MKTKEIAEMKALENKNDLTETEVETVSGGLMLPPTITPDEKPSEGGATGSW